MGNSATKMGRMVASSKLSQKTSKIPPLLEHKSSNEIANAPTKCRFANKRLRNMMKWSPLYPRSSYDIRKCLVSGSNTKIRLPQESWKYDVLSILDSSSAFSAKAIDAAGFVPKDRKGRKTSGTKEILEVEEEPKTGSVRVKFGIQYEDELAVGKNAPRREKFELFMKNGFSNAVQNDPGLVTLILSTSVLTLIYVGKELPQTITWKEKKFEILMGMGGAAAGSLFGFAAGGPVDAAAGAVIGMTAGLSTAWFVKRNVKDASGRSKAYLLFILSAFFVVMEMFQYYFKHRKPSDKLSRS